MLTYLNCIKDFWVDEETGKMIQNIVDPTLQKPMKTNEVWNLLYNDHHLMKMMADTVNMNKESIHKVLSNNLDIRKLCAWRW